MDHHEAIMEEPSQIERSLMTHSNLPYASNPGLLNTADQYEM